MSATMPDPAHKNVKICGLTRPQDIESALRYGASFLGFIVEAASKRKLTTPQAAQLSNPVRGIIPRVAVTVNAGNALLDKIMSEMTPDYIQCHGEETPERTAEIAKKFQVKTIKAVPVSDRADMIYANNFSEAADLILYDARPPEGSHIRGGHGQTIDWTLIRHAETPKSFMLAGGLTPENVKQAIRQTGAPLVDVSSGVEARAGVKDADKIKAFMDAVKL